MAMGGAGKVNGGLEKVTPGILRAMGGAMGQ